MRILALPTNDYEAAEAGVAERVKECRIAKGWTQEQLGVRSGTNQAVIQKIENGRSVRPRCLGVLAIVLGVNPAWLAWGRLMLEEK